LRATVGDVSRPVVTLGEVTTSTEPTNYAGVQLGPGGEAVKMVTLDQLSAALPPGDAVTLIKVDVEGAETLVLRGAERSIREHKPCVVFEHNYRSLSDETRTQLGLPAATRQVTALQQLAAAGYSELRELMQYDYFLVPANVRPFYEDPHVEYVTSMRTREFSPEETRGFVLMRLINVYKKYGKVKAQFRAKSQAPLPLTKFDSLAYAESQGYRTHRQSRTGGASLLLKLVAALHGQGNASTRIETDMTAGVGSTAAFASSYLEVSADGGFETGTPALKDVLQWSAVCLDVQRDRVNAGSIRGLASKQQVSRNLGVLAINANGNELYLWHALCGEGKSLSPLLPEAERDQPAWRPAVAVIKYNPQNRFPRSLTIAYDENHDYDGTNYFSASFGALHLMGSDLGYTAVYASKECTFVYFVRSDLLEAARRGPDAALWEGAGDGLRIYEGSNIHAWRSPPHSVKTLVAYPSKDYASCVFGR
jgi:hypothetical protein